MKLPLREFSSEEERDLYYLTRPYPRDTIYILSTKKLQLRSEGKWVIINKDNRITTKLTGILQEGNTANLPESMQNVELLDTLVTIFLPFTTIQCEAFLDTSLNKLILKQGCRDYTGRPFSVTASYSNT